MERLQDSEHPGHVVLTEVEPVRVSVCVCVCVCVCACACVCVWGRVVHNEHYSIDLFAEIGFLYSVNYQTALGSNSYQQDDCLNGSKDSNYAYCMPTMVEF